MRDAFHARARARARLASPCVADVSDVAPIPRYRCCLFSRSFPASAIKRASAFTKEKKKKRKKNALAHWEYAPFEMTRKSARTALHNIA